MENKSQPLSGAAQPAPPIHNGGEQCQFRATCSCGFIGEWRNSSSESREDFMWHTHDPIGDN